MLSAWRRATASGAGLALGWAALEWFGRTAGATVDERRRRLAGDELLPAPMVVTTHATTIAAAPERVWPWLVQMGWGRAQWYTARWVDRLLFPANPPSADHIVSDLQHLEVGDLILDGPPEAGCAFVVEGLETARHLVLHSRQHLPPGWAERFGAWIDFTWAFVLEAVDVDRTRLIVRSRVRCGPRWLAVLYAGLLVPADLVMARQLLRGIRRRAERLPAAPATTGEPGGDGRCATQRPPGVSAGR